MGRFESGDVSTVLKDLISTHVEEIRRLKGHQIAEEFENEAQVAVLGSIASTSATSIGMGAAGSILGPLGALGGAALGGYFGLERAKNKLGNLKYKYLSRS